MAKLEWLDRDGDFSVSDNDTTALYVFITYRDWDAYIELAHYLEKNNICPAYVRNEGAHQTLVLDQKIGGHRYAIRNPEGLGARFDTPEALVLYIQLC